MHIPSSVMKWPSHKKERAHVLKKVFYSTQKDRNVSFSRFLSSILSSRESTSDDKNSLHNNIIIFSDGRVSNPINSWFRKWAKLPSFSRHCDQQLETTNLLETNISSHGNTDPLRTAVINPDSNAGSAKVNSSQVELVPTDFHRNTDPSRTAAIKDDSNAGCPAKVSSPQVISHAKLCSIKLPNGLRNRFSKFVSV